MTDYALEAEGLSKRSGHTPALAGIYPAVRPGIDLGVLAQKGAGKTSAAPTPATPTVSAPDRCSRHLDRLPDEDAG